MRKKFLPKYFIKRYQTYIFFMNNSNKQKGKEKEKNLFQIERKMIVNMNEILDIPRVCLSHLRQEILIREY